MAEDGGRTRSTGGRGRPKDPRKREAILNAAEELFLRDGFDATSMDAIAAAAGVSKRTIYNHFGTKEALFEAYLTEGEPIISDSSEPADVTDLRQRLLEAGIPLLMITTDPNVHRHTRLMITEAERHPEAIARFFRQGPETMHRDLARLLERADQAGQLSVDDPMLAADQLLSMWLGQYHLRLQFGLAEPRTQEQIVEHVEACITMFLRAYAPRNRREGQPE